MNHSLRFFTMVCAVMTGCLLVSSTHAQQADPQTPLAANLFYNYYTQGAANQVNAAMYLAPRPVPAYVGHSYYTYQPLLPHEHMYSHSRNYYKWYAGPEATYSNPCTGCGQGGSLNKTKVVWYSGANHLGNLAYGMSAFSRIQYAMSKRHYCPSNSQFTGLRGRLGGGGCASGDCGGAAGGCNGGACGGGSSAYLNPRTR